MRVLVQGIQERVLNEIRSIVTPGMLGIGVSIRVRTLLARN